MESFDEQDAPRAPAKQRYKSTKGDADKRKQQSLINLAKARKAKLEQLREKKEKDEGALYIDTESDSYESVSSSSEEEELVITKKSKKPKKITGGNTDTDRLARLESMIVNLAKDKKKKKKVVEKRTIIQMPPQQQSQPQYANPYKTQLLNLI